MVLSVNTNVGAMLALQNLNKTKMKMEATQLAITTGLRVSGPKQDASSYAIAQNMRGDVAGLNSVKTALSNGEAVVNTAFTAGQSVADLLTEMKAKVVQANQAGLDAASLLALQEVPDAAERRRQAVLRSTDIPDELQQLRLGLLTGSVPRQRLQRLTKLLRDQPGGYADPQLGSIVVDIEVRVAVELAKLELTEAARR
ncbi:MAG: flagellar assembly protein FliX [Alphaproteobacteria bacterium]